MAESLIIELDAKTAKLDAKLKSTDANLDGLDKSTKKVDSSLALMSKAGGIAGAVIAKVGGAAVAAAAAITTMAVAASKGHRELELLSKQAKLSVDQFQALAFATEQYGVSAENIADISKDVSDRLGEFATAGTGTFQDFLDVMGMSKHEGKALAKEFQNLSSDQVIGEMVKRMEDASASGNQMTFVLESMGNDLSRLQPLFANNSEELKKLSGAYSDLNKGLSLTKGQAEDLTQLSASFDLMTGTAGNATKAISATLAPTLSSFFNSVIEVVPDATNTIIDFLNTFNEAGDIQNIRSINEELKSLEETITDGVAKGYDKMSRNMQDNPLDFVRVGKYRDALERSNELEAQRTTLLEEQKEREIELAQIRGGGKIGGEGGSGGGTDGAINEELKALEDRFKSEEELLAVKYEKEQELARGNKELLAEIENEYIENLMALDEENTLARLEASHQLWLDTVAEQNQEKFEQEITQQQMLLDQKLINEETYLKNVNKIGSKYGKVDEKETKDKNKKKEDSDGDYANAAIGAADALFGNNKAVKAAGVVVDTAAGISKAFADLPYPAAIGASIQIAATGIAQLSAIQSASKGGGSTPSAPSSAASPVSSAESSDVTGEVEINESIGSGGQTSSTSNTVTITAEDGDELAEAFAKVMNKKLNNGEITLG